MLAGLGTGLHPSPHPTAPSLGTALASQSPGRTNKPSQGGGRSHQVCSHPPVPRTPRLVVSHPSSVPLPGFGDKGGDSQAAGVRTCCHRGAGAPEEAKILGEVGGTSFVGKGLSSPHGEKGRGVRGTDCASPGQRCSLQTAQVTCSGVGTLPSPGPPPPDGCAEIGNKTRSNSSGAVSSPNLFSIMKKMGNSSHQGSSRGRWQRCKTLLVPWAGAVMRNIDLDRKNRSDTGISRRKKYIQEHIQVMHQLPGDPAHWYSHRNSP